MASVCTISTKRGGFTEGGGYDRMNFVRYEACNRPATIEGKCKRHHNLQIKLHQKSLRMLANQKRSLHEHDSGSHDGYEHKWSRLCWKCGQVLVSRNGLER
jgi:hypothetical protein